MSLSYSVSPLRPECGVSISRAMPQACEGPGFFYLKGHGIPEDLKARVFKQMEALFALPLEEKMKVKQVRGCDTVTVGTLFMITLSFSAHFVRSASGGEDEGQAGEGTCDTVTVCILLRMTWSFSAHFVRSPSGGEDEVKQVRYSDSVRLR